jgi:hypothetical protein
MRSTTHHDTIALPFGSAQIGGSAYDPARRPIYLSQQYADGAAPVIEVFKVRGLPAA